MDNIRGEKMKRFAAIMLVLAMIVTSLPEMGVQAAAFDEKSDENSLRSEDLETEQITEMESTGEEKTEAESEDSRETTEQKQAPVLEYVYMTQPEYAGEEGQLIVISFRNEAREISEAVLTYTDAEGVTAAMEVFEIIKGYVVFIAEGTGIEGSNLVAVDVTVEGVSCHIDLQTFYKDNSTEIVEIEEGDNEILEEAEEIAEIAADSESELQDEIQVEDLVAEDTDGISEALQAAEEHIEEETDIAEGQIEEETVISEEAQPYTDAVSAAGSVQLKSKAAGENIIIVLDPGHGGSDPGVTRTWDGVSYIEKDINLKISKYTKNELETYQGVTVYLTRSTDVYVGLKERVDLAESVGATALISQHINSTAADKQETVSGAMIFVSSGNYRPAQAKETWNIASVIMQELVNIGMDNRGLVKTLSENGSTYSNGKLADYYAIVRYSVLANIPGMIVEHGFCNNPSDCKKYYGSNSKIKKLGVADATALAKYYGLKKKDAEPTVGWNQVDSQWYYLNADGTRTYGWATISKKTYYFNGSGYRVTGWKTIDGKKYYFNTNGVMVTGLKKISSKYYWFDTSGVMASGWFKGSDGKRYYSDSKGRLYKGWIKYKKKWYYFDPATRAAAVGFKKINGLYYYFNTNGVRKKGWQKVKNNWYYMNKSGVRVTGMTKLKGKWYYFKKNNGKMITSKWLYYKKKWYYFKSDGVMVVGKKKKIDKKWYRFDGNGVCLNK